MCGDAAVSGDVDREEEDDCVISSDVVPRCEMQSERETDAEMDKEK